MGWVIYIVPKQTGSSTVDGSAVETFVQVIYIVPKQSGSSTVGAGGSAGWFTVGTFVEVIYIVPKQSGSTVGVTYFTRFLQRLSHPKFKPSSSTSISPRGRIEFLYPSGL